MKQMLSDEHRSALVEYRLERAHHTLEEALPLNFSNRLLQQTAKESHRIDMQCPGTVSAHPKAGGIPILNRAGTALLPA